LNNKTNKSFFVALCFLLCVSTSFAQEKESTDIHRTKSSAIIGGVKYYLHTVEKGQTLFAIAKFYKIELNDLVIENPEAIDGIKPGQILRIPYEKKKKEATTAIIDTSNYINHTVEKGQTIYSITKQYGVTDEALKKMNPELLNGLKSGQVIKIPINKPKAETVVPTVNNSKTELPSSVTNENKINVSSSIKTSLTEAEDRVNITSKYSYPTELKEEYNIALFLPFQANEANALDVDKLMKGEMQLPNKTTIALQFYEGLLLAIDSLKKQNLKAKIFVYDVDDKDSLAMPNLLKNKELAEMDLFIGPLYGTNFVPVAKFAKEHQIAIVSPFTQLNKILFENPYVCKVSPSIALQQEQMAIYVVDSFNTQNIVLVNGGLAKDAPFYNSFKTTANALLLKTGKDTVKLASSIASVQSVLSSTKTNVIVVPSNNQSFVTDFISKLHSLREKYKIVIVGMNAWMSYDNLDFEYLNNLQLHTPSNTFINYEDVTVKKFITQYRDSYKTEPELFSYQGFDIGYYFISALQKYGTGFLGYLPDSSFVGIETNYNFSQYPNDSGFENKHVFILKYQDFKIVKAKN